MDIEVLRTYCLSKQSSAEETPFGPDVLVYKVGGKIFALFGIDEFDSINLKCNPERAIQLREEYAAVTAGYHMNKKHWNTIYFGRDMKEEEVLRWIDHSYNLVLKSLPKKLQSEIAS